MKNALAYLAAFCHGLAAAMNLLGILFNLMLVRRGKRENMKDVLIHTFELCYHIFAVYEHLKDIKPKGVRNGHGNGH